MKKAMKHASQTEFGRPESFVPASVDKWELLSALTAAAPDFDLSHRTLGVLRALLTFLPDRAIPAGAGRAVVYPSNRTLSERLNGMPESTLRRHLARLVELGLVNRQDSANRKRYARRVGQGVQVAFGFDLSPLNGHADQIFAVAHAAHQRAERMRVLRDRIAAARQILIEAGQGACAGLLETARLILRRKVGENDLAEIAARLDEAVARLEPVENPADNALPQVEMSATGSQNERHIQDSPEKDIDSERAGEATADIPRSRVSAEDLGQILTACTEFRQYYPGRVRDWQELVAIAEKLSPMIGIDAPVFHDARLSMGAKAAATSVLCILERLGDIRSPGAYLRRLAQKARAGRFSCEPMLKALINRADSRDCQLTI
ncbi:plasmid replication protein RepC [Pseudoruegeria aquimaris]|uniref:plasmid replication protein RepC n=1 Tax=Pseudoruegeria aquimaris TaxID=393663 RepID=UPI001FE2FC55|nr:plasmid replication protein RepC [Pseudoruegeria aquimaris]